MHLHGATAQSVGALRLALGADYKLKKDGPKVQATQRVLFLNLPRLLIMHLSRFTYDVSTGNSKVHKRVHFDAKLLCAFCSGLATRPTLIILAKKLSGRLHCSAWPQLQNDHFITKHTSLHEGDSNPATERGETVTDMLCMLLLQNEACLAGGRVPAEAVLSRVRFDCHCLSPGYQLNQRALYCQRQAAQRQVAVL